MAYIQFLHPEKTASHPRVHPVFLPFAGCPAGESRCVFCAQPLQTGRPASTVSAVLNEARADLDALLKRGAPPRELAFYGGTFTALSLDEQTACLDLANLFRKRGFVTRVRASTRPDRLDAGHLRVLRGAGLDLLELGVQSFDDAALLAARRGYDGRAAIRGCRLVAEAGLDLGIQLMPGMPGADAAVLVRDMDKTVELRPETLRLYPCLVLEGTDLARVWRAGGFSPWNLEKTLPRLAEATLRAWLANIKVIRTGLAPEAGLDEGGILAGPRHPALGMRVRARALCLYISRRLADIPLSRSGFGLCLPRALLGEFWGHKGELKADYAALGLDFNRLRWRDDPQRFIEIIA